MTQDLVKSSNLPPAVVEAKRTLARTCKPSEAADVAGVIVGSYPQRNITNADVYLTQITILLGEYPVSVVKDLAHPYSGIVGKCKFLPTVAEIKEMAESKLNEIRAVIWKHEREERLRAEAKAEADLEARMPPLEERKRIADDVMRRIRGAAAARDVDAA